MSLAVRPAPSRRRCAGRAALAAVGRGRAGRRRPQPLVSAEWLNEPSAPTGDLVVLDIRSAIDGGGAEAYAEAHIPGSVHSDYDKAGWRVTRNDVPFMLPTTAELEKLIGETRHRRGQPRRRRAGRRQRAPISARPRASTGR